MKSLLSDACSKIFKFSDFAEEEPVPETNCGLFSTEAPYIIFTDDDLLANDKAPEEDEEAGGDDEVALESPGETAAAEEAQESAAASFAEMMIEKAEQEAKSIIEEARDKAESALAEAEQKAGEVFSAAKKEGYEKGYEAGFAEGSEEGANRALNTTKDKYRKLIEAVDEACWDIDAQKTEMLKQNIEDLTELALSIAEKVVCVSLESSGEVIKRMILAAAAPAGEEQWAKVVISSSDAKLTEEDGIDLIAELAAISDKIDLVVMDGAAQGTCLVEFPDHVTDASAGIQLQNIKDLVRGADRE